MSGSFLMLRLDDNGLDQPEAITSETRFVVVQANLGIEPQFTDSYDLLSWFYDMKNGVMPSVDAPKPEIRKWINTECLGNVLALQSGYDQNYAFYFSESSDAIAFKLKFSGGC